MDSLNVRLIETAAPSTEPCTAAELRAWARIDDISEDASLATMISAARSIAESFCRRSFAEHSWKMAFDGPPCANSVTLWNPIATSITSITYRDLAGASGTVSGSTYRLDSSGRKVVLIYGQAWPVGLDVEDSFFITYKAGPASPTDPVVKEAVLTIASAIYERRGQLLVGKPEGATGEADVFGPLEILAPAAKALLLPYVEPRL